jgi:hypothetical protein
MVTDSSALTEALIEVIAPLEVEEERRAVAAALRHFEGRRVRVYGAELRIEKRRGKLPDRAVSVLLADLDPYTPYEVVVDADGTVVEAVEQPELVPPFSGAEVCDAVAVARRHPALGDLAERWGVRPAPFYPSTHEHGGDESRRGRRRVGIHFLDVADEADVIPLASVVVDLTSGEPESVHDRRADPPGGSDQEG